MDQALRHRAGMAAIGAFAALSLYALGEVLGRGILGDRAALALVTFAAVFFTGVLAMAGPLRIARAAGGAAVLGAGGAALLSLAGLRYDSVSQIFAAPFDTFAATVVATVPLPFLIAAAGPGWRDYPALFTQAWTITVRFVAAWLFVGVVWLLILLSNMLLSIVGLTLIERLIDVAVVPWLLTGTALGLALAVVTELSDLVSPYLVLRLLRLLLPVVLVVMAVFIVALPLRGFSGLLGGLSVAATLLAMAGAAATLVTTAVDQSDGEATQSPFLARATQALALLLPVPAALAAWAVWLRVADHGWTPPRLFAAMAAVLALGYGLAYAGAVLRGAGWMARIRQANVVLALVLGTMCAAWLTPALNAPRLSARDLVARLTDGRNPAEAADLAVLKTWGRAGDAARVEIEALAAQPGQEALALLLRSEPRPDAPPLPADPAQVGRILRENMALQPPTATAERDRFLAVIIPEEQRDWAEACRRPLGSGGPGCVMVVGDFWPDSPGNEAILVLRDPGGYIRYEGLVERAGMIERRSVTVLPAFPADLEGGEALIAALQAGAPVLTPAPLNQITAGPQTLLILP